LSNRKTPRSRAREEQQAQAPPEWTMPVVRALGKAFSHTAVIPHVFTGVESTFPFLVQTAAAASAPETPSKRPRRTTAAPQPTVADLSDTRVLSLIAVVLFYVLSRMLDQDITPDQYVEWRSKAISTILESHAGRDSTQDVLIHEIEDLMRMAQAEGWLRMDWFSNITPAHDVDDMEEVVMSNGEGRASSGKARSLKDGFASEHIGLGTMMQEATDYLGERQRADYKRWKADIVARIEEIETI
jgi:origin recognition complex subunit 6